MAIDLDIDRQFPERLRKLREHMRPVKSMSVTSELMGLERSKLRRYERGELEPRRPELIAIARYYGVSLDYLCTGKKNN